MKTCFLKKILFTLLLYPALCFGQQDGIPRYYIKICPTAVFPFPAIQPSFEYRFARHFSAQLELGYGFIERFDSGSVQPRGYKGNIEGRYYPFKSSVSFYIGLNVFYRHLKDNWGIRYYTAQDTVTLIHDRFSVSKNTIGLNAVIGFQLVKRRFVMNPFFGGGIMYQQIVNRDNEYAPEAGDIHRTAHHPVTNWKTYSYLEEYSGIRWSVTLGVRLGFVLDKRKRG